jgi:MYXO-CTERM domain-containing protein
LGNRLYRTSDSVRAVQRRSLVAATLALACVAALAAVPLPVSAHVNDVRADPQVSADGTVLVETAYVADDAWLALYSDDGGERGEVIGTRQLGDAGFRTDLAVSIDEGAWRDWSEGEARTVHVALHNDKGSSGFDREEDPVLTFFGREATDQFTLEHGQGAYVGTRAFSPQDTDGPSVTVRTTRLPSDGHLVARNVTNASEGNETALEPVGSTALAAGTHQDVTVELDAAYYERQDTRARIGLTVYRDDGDGRFGPGDEPVRAGDAAVTTFVFLNRTDASGGDGGESSAGDGAAVTTPGTTDGTDGEGGGVVTTATAESTTAPGTTADGDTATTSTDGQPGFGVLTAALAVVAVLAAGGRRRRT